MKTCSYCGKEYPDDAVACILDRSPLVFSQPKSSADPSNPPKKHRPITTQSALSIGGFAVLAGLAGFGLTWLVVGFWAIHIYKNVNDQFVFAAKSMPVLIAGGIIGFIVGLVVSVKVARADPKTKEEIEKKYVGLGGRLQIFLGAPVFVMALLVRFFERLLDKAGGSTGAYVALGIILVMVAVSLVLYDRIPAKLIIPIGVIGWMLTFSMMLWFFLFRSGAF
jgi:hypothetical protein